VTETVAGTASTTDQQPPGLISRLVGVVFSPREAFAAVAARPRVLGALVISLMLTAGAQAGFLFTQVGQDAAVEQQFRSMDSLRTMGVNIPDQAYDQAEARIWMAPYTTAGSILIISPIVLAIFSGLAMMVFNVFLGGEATFKQVYAVQAHAGIVGGLTQVLSAPVNYARGEAGSIGQLSAFFPGLDDMGFFYFLLSAIDVFIIWSIITTSIGLAVLYKRRTGGIATTLLSFYAVIALVIAAFRAS
jgi:hypothetical protein